MASNKVTISLEEREVAVARADSHLEAVAAEWTQARAAGGVVAQKLDGMFTEALQSLKRADRRLAETRKRLERVGG